MDILLRGDALRNLLLGSGAAPLADQLRLQGRGIGLGQTEAHKDPVDLARVLGAGHDVHDAVLGSLHAQGAVKNAVLLRFLTKTLHILLPDREDAKLFVGAEHIGEPYLALRPLLIPQDRVQERGDLLRSGPRNLDGVLTPFQHDFDHLVSCFCLGAHFVFPPCCIC